MNCSAIIYAEKEYILLHTTQQLVHNAQHSKHYKNDSAIDKTF